MHLFVYLLIHLFIDLGVLSSLAIMLLFLSLDMTETNNIVP